MRIHNTIFIIFSFITTVVAGTLHDDDTSFWNRFLLDDGEGNNSFITKAPSLAPRLRHSKMPTLSPTGRAPTAHPTKLPSWSPSGIPTSRPTRTPTVFPTNLPTTIPPTATPVVAPTRLSLNPTPLPSSSLTTTTPTSASPMRTPTQNPLLLDPTPFPTVQECDVILNSTCVISGGIYQGQRCNSIDYTDSACTAKPTRLVWKYSGGRCENSRHGQSHFHCVDRDSTTVPEDSVYIIVTDPTKKGTIVYAQGEVAIGENFEIEATDFPDSLRILVFRDLSDIDDASGLLQEVQMAVSCQLDEPLSLKDQFGSIQVNSFENTEQGEVSCIAPVYFSVILSLPSLSQSAVRLDNLNTLTNFGGFNDFSDLVSGVTLMPGNSFSLDVPGGDIDLGLRRRYTSLMQASATEIRGSRICQGSQFDSFIAGVAEVGVNPPSAAPAATPTSVMPTVDNTLAACSMQVEIQCDCLSRDGEVVGSCEDLVNPSEITCNGFPASSLTFKYAGDGSQDPQSAIVVAESSDGSIELMETVDLGNIFTVDGQFGGSLQLSLYDVLSDGSSGELLSEQTVDTQCETGSDGLKLVSRYGPLTLVSFENALGVFSSIVPIQVTYRIINNGSFSMIAEEAMVTSDFQSSSMNVLGPERSIASGASEVVFMENGNVDTDTKYLQGNVLQFQLNASGRGARSTVPCAAEAFFAF